MDLRNSRLWQDSLAHATIFEGDAIECGKWLGWAKQKLQFMLHSLPGASSQIHVPADGVVIRIDTRPNKISITAGADEYVTYMYPATVTYDKDFPPYQSSRKRIFTNKTHSATLAEFSMAGGLNMYSGTQQVSPSATPGGYWTNRRGFSLSWRNSTVYMNGKYGNLDALPFASVVINATVFTDPAEGYEAVIIAVCYDTISPFAVSFRRYGVDGLTGSGETLSLTRIDKPTDLPAMYPYHTGSEYETIQKGVSTFTATTRAIAYLVPVASNVQVIKLRTYNADFTAYVDTTILSRTLYTVTTGSSGTYTPGASQVVRIQPEGDVFGLVSTNIINFSQTYTSTGASSTNAAGNYSTTSSSVYRFALEILTQDGTATEVNHDFAHSVDDQSIVMAYTRSNPFGSSWFFDSCTKDVTETYSATMVLGYNATHGVVTYLKYGFTNSYSLSGSEPAPTYAAETTQTTTELRSCSLYINTTLVHTFAPYSNSVTTVGADGAAMLDVLTDIVASTPPATSTYPETFSVFYALFSSAYTRDFMVVATTGDGFYPLTNVKFTLYLNLRQVSDYNLITGSTIAYHSGNTEYVGLSVATIPYTLTTKSNVTL